MPRAVQVYVRVKARVEESGLPEGGTQRRVILPEPLRELGYVKLADNPLAQPPGSEFIALVGVREDEPRGRERLEQLLSSPGVSVLQAGGDLQTLLEAWQRGAPPVDSPTGTPAG